MGAHGHRRNGVGSARARLLPLGRLRHGGPHAGALGSLLLSSAILLALALTGCAREEIGVPTPAFARELPGRTVIAAWGDAAHDPGLRRVADALAEPLGLSRVEAVPLAYVVSDDIETGWASLADSRLFKTALREADRKAEAFLYVDLQLLVEAATGLIPNPAGMRERLLRSLQLRGFEFSMVGAYPAEGGGVDWRGQVATSGTDAGLPGLLTATTVGSTHEPEPTAGTRFQLEAMFAPEVARRMADVLFSVEAQSMFAGLFQGPRKAILEFFDAVQGRASVAVTGPSVRVAVTVAPQDGLEDVFERLLPVKRGRLPEVEILDGWAVLRARGAPAWRPPERESRTAGPFLWARGEVPLDGGFVPVLVDVRGRAADRASIRIRFDG